MMVIHNAFSLGQSVFLKTDPEQKERMVIQIGIGGNSSIRYCLISGTQETWHYEIEIAAEKNILIS